MLGFIIGLVVSEAIFTLILVKFGISYDDKLEVLHNKINMMAARENMMSSAIDFLTKEISGGTDDDNYRIVNKGKEKKN